MPNGVDLFAAAAPKAGVGEDPNAGAVVLSPPNELVLVPNAGVADGVLPKLEPVLPNIPPEEGLPPNVAVATKDGVPLPNVGVDVPPNEGAVPLPTLPPNAPWEPNADGAPNVGYNNKLNRRNGKE